MKDRDTQLAFIKARAEGKSYSTISKELGIAKATCTNWEKTFKEEIGELRQEQLDELYAAYGMKREARIKALGETIQRLDKAIAEKPLEELPVDKLLDLRLKYGREIKAEYKEPVALDTDDTLDGLLEQYNQLYSESRAGSCTPADAKALLNILDAKRDIIYRLAAEQDKEDEDPMSLDFLDGYTSKLLRHEEGASLVGNSKWKRPKTGTQL